MKLLTALIKVAVNVSKELDTTQVRELAGSQHLNSAQSQSPIVHSFTGSVK